MRDKLVPSLLSDSMITGLGGLAQATSTRHPYGSQIHISKLHSNTRRSTLLKASVMASNSHRRVHTVLPSPSTTLRH
jgi:hypothetical protein